MNEIKICKADLCIDAKGKYADAIALVFILALILVGSATLIKALK